MKKLLLILLCLPFIGFGQLTYVPDDNFENYLEVNGWGDGVANNDYVTTANINTITYLSVNSQNISDLTGIEDFTALTTLRCDNNQLTSLDVSSNTALTTLSCCCNQLTSLDVSGATALTQLSCYANQISSLDVSNNTALWEFRCQNNQLASLDVSQNTALALFHCQNNDLISLDVSNNTALNNLWARDNPSLFCINVDDSLWATANWTAPLNISLWMYFSNNCPLSTLIQEYTTNKELLKITDILGRETKGTNQPLFYIYDDGTVEKRIVIE